MLLHSLDFLSRIFLPCEATRDAFPLESTLHQCCLVQQGNDTKLHQTSGPHGDEEKRGGGGGRGGRKGRAPDRTGQKVE